MLILCVVYVCAGGRRGLCCIQLGSVTPGSAMYLRGCRDEEGMLLCESSLSRKWWRLLKHGKYSNESNAHYVLLS